MLDEQTPDGVALPSVADRRARFEAWLNEIENYATRGERLRDLGWTDALWAAWQAAIDGVALPEKSCCTCAHKDVPPNDYPCRSCPLHEKWEPASGVDSSDSETKPHQPPMNRNCPETD